MAADLNIHFCGVMEHMGVISEVFVSFLLMMEMRYSAVAH